MEQRLLRQPFFYSSTNGQISIKVRLKKGMENVMWISVLLLLMVTILCFIVIYKLIGIIPKVNKITASIFALLLTGTFTYEWVNNIINNLFMPMP